MKNDKNSLPTTSTKATKETRQQKKQRMKLEKKQKATERFWKTFKELSTNLPGFAHGLCLLAFFGILMAILYFVLMGVIPPETIATIVIAVIPYLIK
jgi:hypothetical protein